MALIILIALINTKERPCYGSGGWSSVSDHEDQGSFPGQWHWDRTCRWKSSHSENKMIILSWKLEKCMMLQVI